ncbi:MAG: antibiotic biosynthesis monooxygenase, partial [Planctomycetes bacterium]|nr:antibiotic biosynthesis monooxygenase [Planctomycetota bacterium]
AEQGCLWYEPTLDVDTNIAAQGGVRPNVVTMVEIWDSIADLEAHLIAPHMIEYRAKVKPMVVSSRLQILEPAAV